MAGKKLLLEKVGVKAHYYQETYGGCGQAVVGAFRSVLGDDIISETVFKSATGLSGGCVQTGNVCGAVSGGVLVISLFSGRDESTWDDASRKERTYELGNRLVDYFMEIYGDINCEGIKNNVVLKNISPESIKISDEGEKETDCAVICRRAAKKVMEILIEEGFVKI